MCIWCDVEADYYCHARGMGIRKGGPEPSRWLEAEADGDPDDDAAGQGPQHLRHRAALGSPYPLKQRAGHYLTYRPKTIEAAMAKAHVSLHPCRLNRAYSASKAKRVPCTIVLERARNCWLLMMILL